jgi:group II intron reverse transcriptase/maturase
MPNGLTDTQDWVRTYQRKLYIAAKQNSRRRFGILYDKVYREDVLKEAWQRVSRKHGSGGVDKISIDWIKREYGVGKYLAEIRDTLMGETYRPDKIRRVYIPKPGSKEQRPLGIPTVTDRVVQMAVKLIIEPLFEADFLDCSYGFRPKRSAHQAVERVHHLINSRKWVVDIDLKSYFDTIPHDQLMEQVRKRVSEKRVNRLIKSWLKAGILEGGTVRTPESGSPQGGVLSPVLSNIYLHQLDSQWDEKDGELIRYADDLVILCSTEKRALNAMKRVQVIIDELGLQLNQEKSSLRHIRDGFDFLGFTFREGKSPRTGRMVRAKMPRKKSQKSIRQKIKDRIKCCPLGMTIREVIQEINPVLRGWSNYFRVGNSFKAALGLAAYVCEQLRTYMRRRQFRKDIRGYRKWPNRFFYRNHLLYLPNLIRRPVNAAI